MTATGHSHDGPPLTPQQAAALGVVAASVALSAGAGCGKTRVLTERYLRYLEGPDRRPLGSIVALTFTEKAARELRQRVRAACRRRLDRGDDPAYWRGVLRGLEAAPIGTFHECCGRLLRRFAVEAGLEPGFGVLEETIAPSFREEALSACLRRWLAEGDPDLHELAVAYSLRVVRQTLVDLIADRGGRDYQLWSEAEPETIVAIWREVWLRLGLPLALDRVARAGEPLLKLLGQFDCTNRVMNERIAWLRSEVPALPKARSPHEALAEVQTYALVKGAGGAEAWEAKDVYTLVQSELAKLRKAAGGLLETLKLLEADSVPAARRSRQFARLAAEAVEAYARLKRDRGLLDFDDLLHHARRLLLTGPDSVRERLAAEISVVLVDEFQDTDPVQAEILERLAAPDLLGGRVFLVGDIKQSIYRFRGAEPRLFEEYRGRFPEAGRKALTENFRSAPGIITFVNALFADRFPGAEHRLEPRSSRYATPDGPAVTFLWATEAGAAEGEADRDEPDESEAQGGRPKDESGNADARRRVEARWLARWVAQRLAEGRPVWDEAVGGVRPAHAGDVVFLFRSLSDAACYENALIAEGLDYYVVGGAAFFVQQEVLDLINLLTAIEDPFDELALAGVLRSPFFGVSDEGLYWLAQAGGGELAAGLARGSEVNDLDETDRQRVERAARLLGAWRARKDREPIARLLDRALAESGYEAALLGEYLGERKRANCRKLVRIAARFDRQGGLTLADFVARLRADLRKPPREEQAATTDEAGQAVRIMTVHQSKGLEFPIVVVPDLDRKAPPGSDRVKFHSELGPVAEDPPEVGPDEANLGSVCIKEIEAQEERLEAHRLLYVATTRARELLVLSAAVGPEARPASPAMQLIAERFDRVTGACLATLPDGLPTPEVSVVCTEPPALPHFGERRRRPRLRAVARTIERSAVTRIGAEDAGLMTRLPRRIDLDPAAGLSPLAARTDRVVRAALGVPAILNDRIEVGALVAQCARRLTPRPSPEDVARAARRLSVWAVGPMHRDLAESPEREQALAWRLSWPTGAGGPPTVITGRLDFLVRDRNGRRCLMVVADAEAPVERERLRLLLAVPALGLDPADLSIGWRVQLQPTGSVMIHGEEQFDHATIAAAFEAYRARLGPAAHS